MEENYPYLQKKQQDPNERSEDGVGVLMTKIASSQEQVVDSKMEIATNPLEQNIEPLETTETTQNEEVVVKQKYSMVDDKQAKQMLLSKALCGAFGEHSANDIQDHCEFEETEVGKVIIKPAIGVSFNDIEKAKIRKCIKSVYGEDVVLALVNTTPYVSKEPVASESGLARSEVLGTPSQNNSQWLNFKGNVRDRKVREILNNPTMKIIEIQGKVIIEGHAFLLEELFSSGYVEELEDTIVETGLTLEFHEKIVSRSYVTPDAKPTILTKEKIMKDREWRKNATEEFGNFINELKAK